MSERLRRAVRQSGYYDTIDPAEEVRLRQAARTVIDPGGGVNRAAILPYLTPLAFRWPPGDSSWWPVVMPCRLVMGWARAEAAPGGGNCIVTFSYETERDGISEGITTITPALSITSGRRFGTVQLAVELNAGSWVRATVSTASGASGVSIALTGQARE
jgi:hypothetical protein